MMKVLLVYAPAPRAVIELELVLKHACTAKETLAQSGWLERFPEIAGQQMHLSVWGRAIHPNSPLRDGDRLEVCRPLRVDPKVARRERFVGQGARGTGLFAQRRPGSKAGY